MMRLTQLRIDAGLSVRALAVKSGLSYQHLLNIERGETANPQVATLHKLADVLAARPSELLMDALPPSNASDVAA
jgi:transcriptional regulator with XRE-family HTH domain